MSYLCSYICVNISTSTLGISRDLKMNIMASLNTALGLPLKNRATMGYIWWHQEVSNGYQESISGV